LFDHCASSGQTPRAILAELASGKLKIAYTSGLIDRFKLLQTRLADLQPLRGQALVDALFPNAEAWTEPFRSIVNSIVETDYEADTLLQFLQGAIIQPELPTDVDYVRIMSLHKSKGLTADLVVVAGCMEGLIPFDDAEAPQEERERILEEQRRLFYVAITRPKQTLVLSSVRELPVKLAFKMRAPIKRTNNPALGQTIASRFYRELGPACPAAVTGSQFLTALVND
jgi:superfamily I DNA/RNA helicase